jgi:hypothetical protein
MRKYMFFSLCLLFCAALLLSTIETATAASQGSSASGSLTLNKTKIKLSHAYVDLVNPDEPVICISDKPLPADAFSLGLLSEGYVREKKVHVLIFSISRKDKKPSGYINWLYFPGKETHFMNIGHAITVTIKRLDDTVIEGKITTPKPLVDDFYKVTLSLDAQFKVSLSKPAVKTAPPKVFVTGDTSHPAKVYAEYYRACLMGDIKKLRGFLSAKARKEFDAFDEKERQMAVEVFKMRPTDVKITKPSITDDTASFSVHGSLRYGEKATGSVKMVLEEGKWKVREDKWASSSN